MNLQVGPKPCTFVEFPKDPFKGTLKGNPYNYRDPLGYSRILSPTKNLTPEALNPYQPPPPAPWVLKDWANPNPKSPKP